MWIVILKRRENLEDITINGRIEMHLERTVRECVDCTHLPLSGDKKLDVLNTLIKPSMP
jgi:hypothetical protein